MVNCDRSHLHILSTRNSDLLQGSWPVERETHRPVVGHGSVSLSDPTPAPGDLVQRLPFRNRVPVSRQQFRDHGKQVELLALLIASRYRQLQRPPTVGIVKFELSHASE